VHRPAVVRDREASNAVPEEHTQEMVREVDYVEVPCNGWQLLLGGIEMSKRKTCVMCGCTGHRYQDGEPCPSKISMDRAERSAIAKRGWDTRRSPGYKQGLRGPFHKHKVTAQMPDGSTRDTGIYFTVSESRIRYEDIPRRKEARK